MPFDFRATGMITAEDEVRHICSCCVATIGGRRGERSWTRTAPRP
ncbi:hypothetical protein [Actinoplanes italicus]|nr:hypothetical protein [Actinoplanes italicus]